MRRCERQQAPEWEGMPPRCGHAAPRHAAPSRQALHAPSPGSGGSSGDWRQAPAGARCPAGAAARLTLDVPQVVLRQVLVERVLAQHDHALVCSSTARTARRGMQEAASSGAARGQQAPSSAARAASGSQAPCCRPHGVEGRRQAGRTVQPLDDLIADSRLACAARIQAHQWSQAAAAAAAWCQQHAGPPQATRSGR